MGTYVYSRDRGNDPRHDVDLVEGPANGDRRFDKCDESGDGLQGQPWTDYDHNGGQYKDDCCASKHEYVPSGVEQGPFGAKDEVKETLNGVGGTHSCILIEMKYTTKSIPVNPLGSERGRGAGGDAAHRRQVQCRGCRKWHS